MVAAPLLIAAAGFTTAGVAAGSLAAGTQAAVYGGATAGVFSALQSAGEIFNFATTRTSSIGQGGAYLATFFFF